MIAKIFVLLISATAWIAILWLLLTPDFSKWASHIAIAVHLLPPFAAWLAWLLWRLHIQGKRVKEAQAREALAQSERNAEREVARKTYDEEMRQRRFACECRAAVAASIGVLSDPPFVDATLPNAEIRARMLTQNDGPEGESILDYLSNPIAEALSAVYATCGASMAFPIFISPPADVPGEEVLARLQSIHADLAEEYGTDFQVGLKTPPILFLPASDCTVNSIISLFETTPDLPGAVILAFDSPFFRRPREDPDFDDEHNSAHIARERYVGKPSEAVVALLITSAELPSMLLAIADALPADSGQDSMTPFWERAMEPGGSLAVLAQASLLLREELAQLPVLGRLHRAVLRRFARADAGVLEMTRTLQDVLERAQVNAGLITPPFAFHDDSASRSTDQPDQPAQEDRPRCGRLVHNAGGVEVAGKRLAAIGSALYYYGIDLSPVDPNMATNLVTRAGDMGRASGIGQLAIGIIHAAQEAVPVLCVEYSDEETVAASFVLPSLLQDVGQEGVGQDEREAA